MALIRWGFEPQVEFRRTLQELQQRLDPLHHAREIRESVRRAFGDAFEGFGGVAGVERGTSTFPPLNIYTDNESVQVEARLPGVDLKDLEISITGDTLSLKGERKLAAEVPEERYHRRERAFGHFNRLVSLNEQVDADKVVATLKDGILRIVLPKKPESRPRQIQVKGA